MRQKTIITKLLQSVTEVYYRVRQVLQSATVITKWDVTQPTLDLCQEDSLTSRYESQVFIN